jgi:hypothetical protein
MLLINYPEPSFRTKQEDGKDWVFDTLRKKWLLLTPEEWVRQNFVHYLTIERKYPATLIALEKEIKLGELKKRFDILVYNAAHQPWMIVECKAPSVKLSDEVVRQALRYSISIPATYIIITNGPATYGWERKAGGLELISEIPEHI